MSSPQPQTPAVHPSVRCDNCGQDPIRGPRYKCVNCSDFDLCHFCEEIQAHDDAHTFLKIRRPRQNADFPFVPAPVPTTAPPATAYVESTSSSVSKAPPKDTFSNIFTKNNDGAPAQNPFQQQQQPQWPAPSKSEEKLYDTVNRFGFQVLHSLIEEKRRSGRGSSSTALSAPNIYSCLLMAAAGSGGTTLDAFAKTMGFGPTGAATQVHAIAQLEQHFMKTYPGVELEAAASVWTSPSYRTLPDWQRLVENVLNGTIGIRNAEMMKMWVSSKTRGRITAVESGMPDDPVTLLTAIYFKANWDTPFEKTSTREEPFYCSVNEIQRCSMMHRTANMSYWEDDVAQLCVLPYVSGSNQVGPFGTIKESAPGPQWKAAVVLPKSRDRLSSIISHFANSPDSLRTILRTSSSQSDRVHLSMPRFTLKMKYLLAQTLREMGLSPAFGASADFSHMASATDGLSAMFLSQVAHSIFVEVNEEGTEMAAVTGTMLTGPPPSSPPPPKEMKVDRPFLFMIFDQKTLVVLAAVVVGEIEGLWKQHIKAFHG